MKKIVAVLFGVVAILIGAAWLIGYSEIYESHFETYRHLKESELIDKVWVPSFIPRSAYDIHEIHRIEVGGVNVRFRFRPGDTKEIEASCTMASTSDTEARHYRCKHGNEMVVIKLETNGNGEILKA